MITIQDREHDQDVVEGTIQPGSGAWLAHIADTMAVATDHPIDAEQADDILNAEYADYLLKRMQDDLYA
ncbi:MAG: hypothetical protein JNJ61_00960 [Anaerolineae bacterium]|nr:hypothetical protein [Anaerolineae bacterium]